MPTSTVNELRPQPPSSVRLSSHFLLSDLLGCDSVYSKGYRNVFEDSDGRKLREGQALCRKVLEPLLDRSRLSISYGYISPELSRKIVKYQDPNKPSYHRWDAGAACDVVLHDRVAMREPPVFSAFWIDENLPVSRVITYSESPYICVATRFSEISSGDHRRALYENRYVGEKKPLYISYADTPKNRRAQKDAAIRALNAQPQGYWGGSGYPTYHGGGRQQLQHLRTSEYTVLSDFLYSDTAVAEGFPNAPAASESYSKFERAGSIYDQILKLLSLRRMSIVRGYESPEWSNTRHTWSDGVYLVVVPPHLVSPLRVAAAVRTIEGVRTVRVSGQRVAIAADF